MRDLNAEMRRNFLVVVGFLACLVLVFPLLIFNDASLSDMYWHVFHSQRLQREFGVRAGLARVPSRTYSVFAITQLSADGSLVKDGLRVGDAFVDGLFDGGGQESILYEALAALERGKEAEVRVLNVADWDRVPWDRSTIGDVARTLRLHPAKRAAR